MIEYITYTGKGEVPWPEELTTVANELLERLFNLPLEGLSEQGDRALNVKIVARLVKREDPGCCLYCGFWPQSKYTSKLQCFVVGSFIGNRQKPLSISNNYVCKDREACKFRESVRSRA